MPSLANALTDYFPWLPDLLVLLLSLGMILFMVYWVRGAKSVGNGFVIHVTDDDIRFSGQFPPHMQALVAEFLHNDVQADGSYYIRGHWEEDGPNRRLIVIVKGESAQPVEQRIRNFLKLNLKPPRP